MLKDSTAMNLGTLFFRFFCIFVMWYGETRDVLIKFIGVFHFNAERAGRGYPITVRFYRVALWCEEGGLNG